MRITIIFAVTQLPHQPSWRIAQVQWHLERPGFLHIFPGSFRRSVHGVTFRRTGQIDDSLRERQLTFRTAEPFERLPCIEGELERSRIGVADILGSEADHSSGDVQGVATPVEHAHEPIQGSIRIGAAYRFVQRRYLVVKSLSMLVKAAPPADCDLVDGTVRNCIAVAQFGGKFEKVQCPSRVAVGRLGNSLENTLLCRVPFSESTVPIGKGSLENLPKRGHIEHLQYVDAGTRQQRIIEFERRVFRCRPDKCQGAIFNKR